MLRFLHCVFFAFILVLSVSSKATIIDSNDYIQYDIDNDGTYDFDIVWASSLAFQFFRCDGVISGPQNYLNKIYGLEVSETITCDNQLLSPEYADDSWLFVEDVEGLSLSDIGNLFSAGKFKDAQDLYITAFSSWNISGNNYAVSVNINETDIISNWTNLGQPLGDVFLDNRFYQNVFFLKNLPLPDFDLCLWL